MQQELRLDILSSLFVFSIFDKRTTRHAFVRRVLVVAGKGRESGPKRRREYVGMGGKGVGGGDGVRRRGRGTRRWDEGEKNDNHRHFNNMQRYSRLPRRASVATMALYNDKDTPGRLGTFRSTKGAALGSSYRTGTCFVRRGQMSPIMSWRSLAGSVEESK